MKMLCFRFTFFILQYFEMCFHQLSLHLQILAQKTATQNEAENLMKAKQKDLLS